MTTRAIVTGLVALIVILMSNIRIYRVGVFVHKKDNGRYTYSAYTQWYSPSWSNCREYDVEAANGSEAKKKALALAKAADAASPEGLAELLKDVGTRKTNV